MTHVKRNAKIKFELYINQIYREKILNFIKFDYFKIAFFIEINILNELNFI